MQGSLVRPKMVSSTHYCPATKKTMQRKYTDMTSLDPYPSSAAYPTKDEDGNLLETEFGLSTYKDHQTYSIQVCICYNGWCVCVLRLSLVMRNDRSIIA